MEVAKGVFRERPAYFIRTPSLTLVVMETGAHLASLTLPGEGAESNPLWCPQWPAGDPTTAAALGTWGAGEHAMEAPLLASICGSNLCCDRFGPSYPGEEQRPLHGEAGVMAWTWVQSTPTTCAFEACLPISRLTVRRSFTVDPAAPSRLRVESRLRLDGAATAPQRLEVCEHTTLGNAFLDSCTITATVGGQAYEMPPSGSTSEPTPLPSAAALAVPGVGDAPCGSVRCVPVTPGQASWSAEGSGRRLTVQWASTDFPWLCLWTEHKSRGHPPWAFQERTRGMEISTKPFPQIPPASRESAFLGIPAVEMIAPGQEVTKTVEFDWSKLSNEC